MKKLFKKNGHFTFSGSSLNQAIGAGRSLMAEQLESRILYSGAPIEVPFDQPAHEVKQTEGANFEGITGYSAQLPLGVGAPVQSSAGGDPMIMLTSLDNLSREEVNLLLSRQWAASQAQGEAVASKPLEYKIVEVEVEDVGEFHGYEVWIDTENDKDTFADVRLEKGRSWYAKCDTTSNATYGLDGSGGNPNKTVSYGWDFIAKSLENTTTYQTFV